MKYLRRVWVSSGAGWNTTRPCFKSRPGMCVALAKIQFVYFPWKVLLTKQSKAGQNCCSSFWCMFLLLTQFYFTAVRADKLCRCPPRRPWRGGVGQRRAAAFLGGWSGLWPHPCPECHRDLGGGKGPWQPAAVGGGVTAAEQFYNGEGWCCIKSFWVLLFTVLCNQVIGYRVIWGISLSDLTSLWYCPGSEKASARRGFVVSQ